jgi:hypothetical protein
MYDVDMDKKAPCERKMIEVKFPADTIVGDTESHLVLTLERGGVSRTVKIYATSFGSGYDRYTTRCWTNAGFVVVAALETAAVPLATMKRLTTEAGLEWPASNSPRSKCKRPSLRRLVKLLIEPRLFQEADIEKAFADTNGPRYVSSDKDYDSD